MRQPLVLAALATLLAGGTALAEPTFNRIATFQVPLNLPADRDAKKKTVAEITAANEAGTLLAYTDAEIGRVIQTVQDLGELDNTLIIYISGDNGASAEGSPKGGEA